MTDWGSERAAKARAYQEGESADFFSVPGRDIPDLEFLTPDCPVCTRPTDFDDGSFFCEVCCVTWPRSGYGHEAVRHDD